MSSLISRAFHQLRGIYGNSDATFAPLKALRLADDGRTPEAYDLTPDYLGADPAGTAAQLIDDLLNGWTPERVFTSSEDGVLGLSSVTSSELSSLTGISGNVQALLNGRSLVGHTHAISEVNGLLAAMSNKADLIGGTVPSSQLPALVKTDVFTVGSQSAMLALVAESGDLAIRTDLSKTFAHNGGATGTVSDWSELITPTDAVTSVNGLIGNVTLGFADVGAASMTDSRLANARTPTAHALSHIASGSDALTLSQSQITGLTAALTGKLNVSGGDLSGNLRILHNGGGANIPSVRLGSMSNPDTYSEWSHSTGGGMQLYRYGPTGGLIDIGVLVANNTGDAVIRLGRTTNTAGRVSLDICRGSNTTDVNCRLSGNTHSFVNFFSGFFGVGTATPEALLDINGDSIRIRNNRSISASASPGIRGEVCWDTAYLYVCVATNTWRRTALSTF